MRPPRFSMMALTMGIFCTAAAFGQAQLKTTKLSIFKNGTYFLKKEGTLQVLKGEFVFTPPMQALNGTFWAAVDKSARLRSISVREDTLKVQTPVLTMQQLLYVSKNKTVTIRRKPFGAGTSARETTGVLQSFDWATGVVKLKMADGKLLMFNLSQLEEVQTDAGAPEFYLADSIARVARGRLDKEVPIIQATTVAMELGMRWYPSYLLRVINGKEARLEMKATIENMGEPIRDAEVDVVVGNPTMFYEELLDPICKEYIDEELLEKDKYKNVNGRLMSLNTNVQSAEAFRQRSGLPAEWAKEDFKSEYSADGEKSQDLYYYKLGKLDIDKYAKVIVPVFASTITYKDIYEANIGDDINYFANKTVNNAPDKVQEVFHSLRITNATGAPFTSAPIFVINENESPLAQDELKYVPVGAEGVVHLSKAIDVQVKNEEEELSRVDNFKKISKVPFHKVTLKGEIKIANFQSKKISLNLKKGLLGDVTAASDEGKIVKQKNNNIANPTSIIKWELELNPGEQRTITYEYTVLIR
jgi:hypothetical protein